MEHEIDLHGMRPGAALQAVDRHIQKNHAARSPWVHLVHGRGSGTLRARILDALAANRLVFRSYSAPPHMGGDGVTIVELEYGQNRVTRRKLDTQG